MRKQEREVQKALQELINTDAVAVPETLQNSAVEARLTEQKPEKKKNHTVQRIVSIAAAAAVVVLGAAIGIHFTAAPETDPANTPTVAAQNFGTAPMKSAESYEELENLFLDIQEDYKKSNRVSLYGWNGSTDEIAAGSSAGKSVTYDAATGTTTVTTPSEGYGGTNLQVENVDEADILKNDGEFLYLADSTPLGCIRIVRAVPATELEVVAEIYPKSALVTERESGDVHGSYSIENLYLYDNLLIAIVSITPTQYDLTDSSSEVACYANSYNGFCRTAAFVYDISDREAPKEVNCFILDGTSVSTRMVGSRLILVTNYTVPIYKDKDLLKDACVPTYTYGGATEKLPVQDVCILETESRTESYLTVAVLDVADENAQPACLAVLGGGDTCYCTETDLFLANTVYGTETEDEELGIVAFTRDPYTQLFRFDISEESPRFRAFGTVNGYVDDQFSMDSYGGYFRIATTTDDDGAKISVLDDDLQTVGAVSGLGVGEQIYAVRFMQNTAYIVTFRQTDPLFVVDLSDPTNPVCTGELTLPGFSDYLHPYSENLVIGVGYDGTQSGANSNIKISLFDVSDPQNPKEVSKAIYQGANVSSVALYDPKAYLTLSQTGEFAIPITKQSPYGGSVLSYLTVLRVTEDNKLEITGAYGAETSSIQRGTYIGNVIYTLSDYSDYKLNAYDKTSQELICSLQLAENRSVDGQQAKYSEDYVY